MGDPLLRVHYCHGLESGPKGYKAEALRQWFAAVDAPDMRMSLTRLSAKNSLTRSVLRQVLRVRPTRLAAAAVADSFDRCVQVQATALAANADIDVLVGSSWGGAVALVLVAEEIWTGPAVILCPALGLLQSWMRPSGPPPQWGRSVPEVSERLARLQLQRRSTLLLVHGDADQTVPLAHSRAMAEATGIELVEVRDGTHGLSAIVRDERLRRYVETVAHKA